MTPVSRIPYPFFFDDSPKNSCEKYKSGILGSMMVVPLPLDFFFLCEALATLSAIFEFLELLLSCFFDPPL